ncbi:Snf7 family protein [archaeon]|jgi:division protein CdvB (Snf7/Vps24/ESCRT-III family)|nr:Snf7 family protein [archaeon]NHV05824.1 Snf7 family protein [Nitrososphaerota archaeon]
MRKMVLDFLFGRNKVKPEKPIEPIAEKIDYRQKIQEINVKLRIQKEKLERSLANLEYKNKQLFDKVVKAQAEKNKDWAVLYANEMVQVKKIASTISTAIAALEKVSLRLETVLVTMDVKDLLTSPEVAILKPLSESLRGVMPEVSMELNKISESLDEVALSFGAAEGYNTVQYVKDEDVQSILREASIAAAQRIKNTFAQPDLDSLKENEKASSATIGSNW